MEPMQLIAKVLTNDYCIHWIL